MRKAELKLLKRTLINGGVAPAFVTRTLRELCDHCDDLEIEARRAGCSAEQAAEEARTRLGRQRMIAEQILARPELRSWAFRWLWVPAVLRQLVVLVSVATVPVVVIVGRGPVITRWCVSTGLAVLFTSGLLFLMQRLIVASAPL